MALQVYRDYIQGLGYDLDGEIAAYTKALKAHATTEDEPAPMTTALVEQIVKEFGGQYEITERPAPTVAESLTMATDALAKWQEMVVTRLDGLDKQAQADTSGAQDALAAWQKMITTRLDGLATDTAGTQDALVEWQKMVVTRLDDLEKRQLALEHQMTEVAKLVSDAQQKAIMAAGDAAMAAERAGQAPSPALAPAAATTRTKK